MRLGLDALRRNDTYIKASYSIPSLAIPKPNLPSKRKNPPSAIPKSLSVTQSALNPNLQFNSFPINTLCYYFIKLSYSYIILQSLIAFNETIDRTSIAARNCST